MTNVNANPGSYWRIAWSSSWREKAPWSLDKELMPYIGFRRSKNRGVSLWTFGPVGVIRITISQKREETS